MILNVIRTGKPGKNVLWLQIPSPLRGLFALGAGVNRPKSEKWVEAE